MSSGKTEEYIKAIETSISEQCANSIHPREAYLNECRKFNLDVRKAFLECKNEMSGPAVEQIDQEISKIKERLDYMDTYDLRKAKHYKETRDVRDRLNKLHAFIRLLKEEKYEIGDETKSELERLTKLSDEMDEYELQHLPSFTNKEREKCLKDLRRLKHERNFQFDRTNPFADENFKNEFIARMKSKIDYRTIGQYFVEKCNNSLFKDTQLKAGIDVNHIKYLVLGQESLLSPREFSVLILYPYKGFIRTDIWK